MFPEPNVNDQSGGSINQDGEVFPLRVNYPTLHVSPLYMLTKCEIQGKLIGFVLPAN